MIQVRGVNVYPSAVEAFIREEPNVVEFQVDIRKEREMWETRIEIELDPAASDDAVRAGLAEALGNRRGIRTDVDVVAAASLPGYELKARRFRIHRS